MSNYKHCLSLRAIGVNVKKCEHWTNMSDLDYGRFMSDYKGACECQVIYEGAWGFMNEGLSNLGSLLMNVRKHEQFEKECD
jgi:hypothetical protein